MLTREQDVVADELAGRYGRCGVREVDGGLVLLVGMVDDVEMCHLVVDVDGGRRRATAEELRAWGPRASGLFAVTEHGECCPTCGRLVA